MNEILKEKFDVSALRADFPTLKRLVYGKDLVYFDNGATSQKPQVVIDSISRYYTNINSNVHRGVHTLSQEATAAYEEGRQKIQHYINAEFSDEVIFTKGTTDSINLIASSFGKKGIQQGDEIIITEMEHHSNIVPWQMLCEEKGATLKVIPISDQGELDLDAYAKMLNSKTKIVSVTHISNTLGTINPVREIIALAHEKEIPVLIDGAQAVPHKRVDVRELDADFYAFSMHKMFGPTGIGVLYGKKELLESLPPYQGGGDMIKTVSFEKTTYNELPYKFEAGTPNIAGGVASGAAVDYLNNLNWDEVYVHEKELLDYATKQLKEIKGLRIIGEADDKASVISLIVDGIHAYDIGIILDKLGIAVRTGHHCTEPLMHRFDILGTVRASFAFYNTKEEIDLFLEALSRAIEMLK